MRNRIPENQNYQEEAYVRNPEKRETRFKALINQVARSTDDDIPFDRCEGRATSVTAQ
jgi:hypothetical protein